MKTLRDAVFHFNFKWPGDKDDYIYVGRFKGKYLTFRNCIGNAGVPDSYERLGTRQDFEAEARKIMNEPDWENAPSDAEYAGSERTGRTYCWYKDVSDTGYKHCYGNAAIWGFSCGSPNHGPLIPRPRPDQCEHVWSPLPTGNECFAECKRCNSTAMHTDENTPKAEQQWRGADSCKWEYDEAHNYYEGECGFGAAFTDRDGHDYNFCPECGRRIEISDDRESMIDEVMRGICLRYKPEDEKTVRDNAKYILSQLYDLDMLKLPEGGEG